MRSIAAMAASGSRRPRPQLVETSTGVLDHLADPELGGRVLVLVCEAGDEPDVRAELQPAQRPVEGFADGRRLVRGGEQAGIGSRTGRDITV